MTFDDTIHDRSKVPEGRRMGPPTPGAVSSLRRLANEGHQIVIFTARATNPATTKAVADWMDFFQVPYNDITNVKSMKFDLIIDNRSIHYDSWPQVMNKLRTLNDKKVYYDWRLSHDSK